MITKIAKWISVAGLLLAALWRPSENYQLLLQFVVCASALLVAWGAYSSAKYLWGIGFAAIAIIFNPIQPLAPSREMFLWLDLLSMATFLVSLVLSRPPSRFSTSSMTSRTAKSRAL
jgi:hypothetical protein